MSGRPIRVFFERHGDARFLSHLDFLRVVERSVRRSGLPVTFTEGFNPRIRISLPAAVPVGVSSRGDAFGLRVEGAAPLETIEQALAAVLPAEIRVLGVEEGPFSGDLEPVWLSIEVNDGSAAAEAVAATLRAGGEPHYAGARAHGGVVSIPLATCATAGRPPRARDCMERVLTILEAAGHTAGIGATTRVCGREAQALESALRSADADLQRSGPRTEDGDA